MRMTVLSFSLAVRIVSAVAGFLGSLIRIGLFLEIETTLGALAGAYLAVRISTDVVGMIFGAVLIYSALLCNPFSLDCLS